VSIPRRRSKMLKRSSKVDLPCFLIRWPEASLRLSCRKIAIFSTPTKRSHTCGVELRALQRTRASCLDRRPITLNGLQLAEDGSAHPVRNELFYHLVEGRRRVRADAKQPRFQVSPSYEYGAVAPGGGSGDGTRSRKYGGDNDDNEEDRALDPEIEALLRREERGVSSLPEEFQRKVGEGSLAVKDLKRLLIIEKIPLIGALASRWPGLRSRLVANPRFMSVMAVELVIGFFSKSAAEVKQRGRNFWSEFDFYLSDIMLELVGDFALVWLLSPTMNAYRMPATNSAFTSLLGHLERLPKFALQPGMQYTLGQRSACLLLKGLQFGAVGFCASVVGHSLTKLLVYSRRCLGPQSASSSVKLAPVLANSISWGAFMGLSSNLRYQAVSAVEARMLEPLLAGAPAIVFTTISFLLRFANTYIGGVHWIQWARWTGVQ